MKITIHKCIDGYLTEVEFLEGAPKIYGTMLEGFNAAAEFASNSEIQKSTVMKPYDITRNELIKLKGWR